MKTESRSAGRDLAPGTYGLADLRVGDCFDVGHQDVTADLVDRFADLTGDRFAIHMSDQAARDLGFSGRVAHGLLILSLVDGLKNRCQVKLRAVASLGWDWKFVAPVLVGDSIHGRVSVTGLRQTSDPTRGVAHLSFDVSNARDDIVQTGTNTLMMLY